MKKLIVLASSLAILFVFAPSANAQWHGTRCKTVYGPTGSGLGQVCTTVNTHDFNPSMVESLSFVDIWSTGSQTQWDWLHLYRVDAGPDTLLDALGRSRWFVNDTLSGGPVYSGNWKGCRQNFTYRAVARVRMKKGSSGTPGPWNKIAAEWTATTYCQP